MSFVDLYLNYTKDAESPARYLYWSALAAIASVARDNVCLPRQFNATYPNIFVLFVGPSGMRKGFPVAFAEEMAREVNNTKIFSGRASIQGIVNRLATAETREEGGPPIVGASGTIFASEFANSLIADDTALTQLTDLYDGQFHKKWDYVLKGTSTETLKRPCVTMVSASNEDNLNLILRAESIRGGFLARTFIIYETGLTKINPQTSVMPEPFPREILYEKIRKIAETKGEFAWTTDGAKLYEDWYEPFRRDEAQSRDSTGTMARLHEHVVKVSMLVSLSRGTDLLLTKEDVNEAIQACQNFVPGNRRIAMGQGGKAISAPGTAVVIKALIQEPNMAMPRAELLANNWAWFDEFDLQRILESLFAQGAIQLPHLVNPESNKREAYVILNPKYAEKYAGAKSNGHGLKEKESKEEKDDGDSGS